MLSREEIKMIKTPALAAKHNCSDVYVRSVLIGTRACKSLLARMILKDACDILKIFGRDTKLLMKDRG